MLSQVLEKVEKRLKATGQSAAAASKAAGLSEDAIRNMKRAENKAGRAGVSTRTIAALARVLQTTSGWLMDGVGPEESAGAAATPLLGLVGANADSTMIYSPGGPTNSSVPALSWAPGAVAIQVVGDSCGEIYPDGSILWFERKDAPPSPDLIGEIVVAETEGGLVLVKRLERGEKKGLYDLKSVVGETLRGQRVKWAARILSSVKPPTSHRLVHHAIEQSS